jgi:hypothetical protein
MYYKGAGGNQAFGDKKIYLFVYKQKTKTQIVHCQGDGAELYQAERSAIGGDQDIPYCAEKHGQYKAAPEISFQAYKEKP